MKQGAASFQSSHIEGKARASRGNYLAKAFGPRMQRTIRYDSGY